MTDSRRTTFALGVFTLLAATMAFGGTAKGTLTVNGKTFALNNVYAKSIKNPFDKAKMDVVVILTDKEIPAGALFDDFALMSLADQGISGVTVEIQPDKSTDSGTIFSPAFKKMHQFSSTGNQKLELTDLSKTHVAGSISIKPDDFFEEKYQYSATFDASVLTKPAEKPVVLKGAALPADGGEPAKAWQAYRKAMTAGDIAAIRKLITADHVKDTEDPDFKKMLPMIREMQPKHVKITKGSIDGDTATLLVKDLDEKNSNGTITMQREGGQWKLSRESWKTKSE